MSLPKKFKKKDGRYVYLKTFSRDAEITLFDLGALKKEIQAAMKRPVDLLTRRFVEQSRNRLRRGSNSQPGRHHLWTLTSKPTSGTFSMRRT